MKAAIQNLLEKYFEGKTSLREEAELKAYFREGKVPKELESYQALFRYFEDEKQRQLGSRFDDQLFQQLKKEDKPFKIGTIFPQVIRIAAAIAMLIGAFFVYQAIDKTKSSTKRVAWENYEIKDPQLAFEETKAALLLVSSKLNGGASKAAKEVGKIKKVSKIFK